MFILSFTCTEFSTPRDEDDHYTSSSDLEASPMLQTTSTMWSKLQLASADLMSILISLGKICGFPSTPHQNLRKKLDKSENLSQFHTRHFRHRQLPHLRASNSTSQGEFSNSHVRTRKTSSWSELPITSDKKSETRQQRFSFPLALSVPISMKRQRIGRHKKYSTLQALYLTLLLGELRIDLIELATVVCLFADDLYSSQIIDELIIAPSNRLKKWMKGNS